MAEEKNSELLLPSKNIDNKKKKKKKKRKKTSTSTTPPKDTEKPHTVAVPPDTSSVSLSTPVYPPQVRPSRLRTASRKDGDRLSCSSRTGKKPSKDSPTDRTGMAPKQEWMHGLRPQTKQSLRWEEALEDPQAEEERLELYRAKRRQRYMVHRAIMLREAYAALRQTFHKEKSEESINVSRRCTQYCV